MFSLVYFSLVAATDESKISLAMFSLVYFSLVAATDESFSCLLWVLPTLLQLPSAAYNFQLQI